MVDNLVFRMEVGSYQARCLPLCLYIIWSSWSPQLLHMIWYSGAHWSMANCTVSLFFTSLHTPTFKLLKLDLRTWTRSSTPSLSFRGKPLTYRSNEWAWISVAQKLNLRKHKYYNVLYTSNTTKLLCHSRSLSLFFEVPVFSSWHLSLCLWPYFVSNMNKAASQKLKVCFH